MSFSQILEYRVTSNVPGIRDGTVLINNPIKIISRRAGIQLMKVAISRQIPNIYSYGDFNNTSFRISKDDGVTYSTFNIPEGIYSVLYLKQFIIGATNSLNYWTDPNATGFNMSYNNATQFIYVEIDSTKLAIPSQFRIDFGISDLWDTLGFSINQTIINDGITIADKNPKIDSQGSYISVELNSVCDYLRVSPDGTNTKILCVIPIESSSTNEILYLQQFQQIILCTLNPTISQFSVRFLNGYGRPLYLITGNVLVEFSINQFV